MGIAKRSFGNLSAGRHRHRRRPGRRRRPGGRDGQLRGPPAGARPASRCRPLMTDRSLSVQFHTLTVPAGRDEDRRPSGRGQAQRRLRGRHRLRAGAGTTTSTVQPADALRMSMPINVRTEATENVAGNQFAPARFPVPLTVVDPVHRMKVVRDLVVRARAEPALALTEPLANMLNRLPPGHDHRHLRLDAAGRGLRDLERPRPAVPDLPERRPGDQPVPVRARWPAPRPTSPCSATWTT